MAEYKGIYFDKQYQKWHVRVSLGGRQYHVGRYDSLEEAITARDEFIPDMHRPYAPRSYPEVEELKPTKPRRSIAWFHEESKRQLRELPKLYA